MAGVRPKIVGTNTPPDEIVSAAAKTEADAVAISMSLAGAGIRTDRMVSNLRAALPPSQRLIVGGEGTSRVRRKRRDIDWFSSLTDFHDWLAKRPWAVATS